MAADRYDVVRRAVPSGVTLVAVSKEASIDAMRAVHARGQRDFGENRVDALARKAAQMPSDARWHFLGAIQSNKLRALAELKPLVHSFDRPDLAAKWPRDVPVLLQVDFTGLEQRSGIPPAEVPAALHALRAAGVLCRGLSTLPPLDADPRPVFRALRALRDEHKLAELSMGMSADFEIAVEEGATMVRVGRAIFGEG